MFLQNVGAYQLKYRLSHPKDHNAIITTARFSDIFILFRFLEDNNKGKLLVSSSEWWWDWMKDWLTNYVTDSMEWSHSWETTSSSVSQEIHYILWNPEVYKSVPLVITLNQINPVHALIAHFIHIGFNIVPSMPRSYIWSLSLKFLCQCSQNMSKTRAKWHRCSDVLGFLSLWQ